VRSTLVAASIEEKLAAHPVSLFRRREPRRVRPQGNLGLAQQV
jgi:hypothetical protein